jgi:hypothetical protein
MEITLIAFGENNEKNDGNNFNLCHFCSCPVFNILFCHNIIDVSLGRD